MPSVIHGSGSQSEGRQQMMGDWLDMTAYDLGHWVVFAVMIAIVLYPIGRIRGRIGLSPLWSVLAVIPLVNLIGLWVLAFADWPGKEKRGG
ncbi:hypothetical protein ACVOMV_26220 (plasmid) [Mesorhizobium atlanticum]|uniref:hypothetical protein n=1 Tax=Mesorhizobium atlanticum TaxID=2233532 RepID=UPI0037045151